MGISFSFLNTSLIHYLLVVSELEVEYHLDFMARKSAHWGMSLMEGLSEDVMENFPFEK